MGVRIDLHTHLSRDVSLISDHIFIMHHGRWRQWMLLIISVDLKLCACVHINMLHRLSNIFVSVCNARLLLLSRVRRFELDGRRWSTNNVLFFEVIVIIFILIVVKWDFLLAAMDRASRLVRIGASFERACLILLHLLRIAVSTKAVLLGHRGYLHVVCVPGLSTYYMTSFFLLQTLLCWRNFMS